MKYIWRLALVAPSMAMIFFPLTALASEDPFASESLGEEMVLFQDIPSVFGASKYEQKVTEAPSSISIVTAAEIRKYGYRTLADILASLRSFYITNDRSYLFAGVRGFGRPGDYNSRILILVDGHRYNDNIYQSGFIGNEFGLDVDLIDRVEVIRGPASSLYGTSAFFGVVNVITKRGRDLQGLEVAGTAGTHETQSERLSYGKRFGNGFEVLASGTLGRSDGTDRHYPEFDDPATNHGNAEDLDEEKFEKFFLKTTLGDFTLSGLYVDRDKDYPTAAFETVFNYPDSRTTDERYYADLKYDHSFGAWHLLGHLFYDSYWYEGLYPYDWADYDADPSALPEIVVGRDEAEGNWWGGDVQVSRQLGTHRLVTGVDFRDNLKQDQFYWDDRRDQSSRILASTEHSEYWAAFLQDEFHLSRDLILNAGLRYDDYSTFGGTTNPRLALIYTPVEQTSLKLLYGEAFRAPNVYEQYYHDGGSTSKANPDIDPETISTYEAVWEQYVGDHLRGVLAGFYYEIEDLISQKADEADGLLIYDNLEEAEAWGVEMELEGKLATRLSGRVSYTYQETEDGEGNRLSNSPRSLAKANLTIPVWKELLFLGVEEQYTSSRKTVSGGETGGFATTNLTLSGQNLLPGLELSASVYNLFDKEYSAPGSTEHRQDSIPQDERLFLFKLVYLF